MDQPASRLTGDADYRLPNELRLFLHVSRPLRCLFKVAVDHFPPMPSTEERSSTCQRLPKRDDFRSEASVRPAHLGAIDADRGIGPRDQEKRGKLPAPTTLRALKLVLPLAA
jgi:hypothetical protein